MHRLNTIPTFLHPVPLFWKKVKFQSRPWCRDEARPTGPLFSSAVSRPNHLLLYRHIYIYIYSKELLWNDINLIQYNLILVIQIQKNITAPFTNKCKDRTYVFLTLDEDMAHFSIESNSMAYKYYYFLFFIVTLSSVPWHLCTIWFTIDY